MKAVILPNNNRSANAPLLLAFLFFCPVVCRAHSLSGTGAQGAPSEATGYAVTQVGPHSRVWQNPAGQSVTEIATGMHYWNGQQWTPSDPSFVVSQDGTSFVAAKIQDPTKLAANLNCAGAVTVTTPDNVTLRSTPIAIGLYDAASGKSVILATLTNTTGVLVDPRHVVYDKAFVGGGISASVVYSLPDSGSFHQDVVFTGFDQPFDPTVWGFAAASTNTLRIQIFTEFYDCPQPQMLMRPLYIELDQSVRASMATPDLIDYSLDFGDYVFGPGRAYASTTNFGASSGATVAKDFVTSEGRTFLVESIPYQRLVGALQKLPAVQVASRSIGHRVGAKTTKVAAASLPRLRAIKQGSVGKTISAHAAALAAGKSPAIVVDYVVTVSSSTTPVVYSSDTTYFVTGTVYDSAAVTMESAVFKYPTYSTGGGSGSGSGIVIQNTLTLDVAPTLTTTNYRPAIFTAADDDTAGAALSSDIWSGYTGNPGTNHYGNVALVINEQTTALHNLRFCYMTCAIQVVADSTSQLFSLLHSELVDCITGISVNGGGSGSGSGSGGVSLTLNAYNCLMANVQLPFEAGNVFLTGNACNCTIDSCSYLLVSLDGASGSFSFTNSILSGVAAEVSGDGFSLIGGYNAFASDTAGFGSPAFSFDAWESAGAGNYYLFPDSLLLDAGTINIDAGLLAQLQVKTTQAPLILTNVFTNNTILMPVVQRDTDGPALGFHYDPIDYIAACSVSNATLLLTNGVALAYYDNLGIWLQDNSQLVSQGTPNQRNYLVYYGSVQEQPTNISGVTNALAQALPIASCPFGTMSNPCIFLRLTTICAPTGETNLLDTGDTAWPGQIISNLTLRDCEIYGSGANWQMKESNNIPMVGLTNNVFYRVPFAISNDATITSYNNLFYGTTNVIANVSLSGTTNIVTNTLVTIRYSGTNSSPNTNENNVFDGVTASLDGTIGYNAYLNGGTNVSIHTNDIETNLTWLGGVFGAYYQATNSPLLTNGSTYASNLGLYQYTVTTNYNEVEGTNIVSRGYHYVGVGTNGLALDTSGDGVPDYLADTNGNGGAGWTNYISQNGLSSTNSLLVFTPLQ